jgi:hypothetical protein
MKHLHLFTLPLVLLLGSGCYVRHTVDPGLFAAGKVVGGAVATEQAENEHERREVAREEWFEGSSRPQIVYVTRYENGPPSVDPTPPFDPARARAVLAQVDLRNCREKGAPQGYGHAKVTMNPSGDISKVVIDEPSRMPAAAVKCIGDELGRATVPVFRGSFVTIGTTWYVP